SIINKRVLVARTQTPPSPAAMSPPKPGTPASMVATTLLVCGSIRETLPSVWFSTHTPPSPTARKRGWTRTGMVATTVLVFGSIRWTEPFSFESASPVFVTQTDPKPAIAAKEWGFTLISATTLLVSGSMREGTPFLPVSPHTAPSAAARLASQLATVTGMVAVTVLVFASMRQMVLSLALATQTESNPTAMAAQGTLIFTSAM